MERLDEKDRFRRPDGGFPDWQSAYLGLRMNIRQRKGYGHAEPRARSVVSQWREYRP
jgi:hypothetical protein